MKLGFKAQASKPSNCGAPQFMIDGYGIQAVEGETGCNYYPGMDGIVRLGKSLV